MGVRIRLRESLGEQGQGQGGCLAEILVGPGQQMLAEASVRGKSWGGGGGQLLNR